MLRVFKPTAGPRWPATRDHQILYYRSSTALPTCRLNTDLQRRNDACIVVWDGFDVLMLQTDEMNRNF